MKTIEAFTPNQLNDIRDFDSHVDVTQQISKSGLDNPASQKVFDTHNQAAFELYYSLTRNETPEGKILVDGEMVSLLNTRMEQRGVKQYK